MSGSNPVYQPTTVTYERGGSDGLDEMVYVPTFVSRQSQSRRLLPTAVFVGGIMVGVLALSFIIVGSSRKPSSEPIHSTTATSPLPTATALPEITHAAVAGNETAVEAENGTETTIMPPVTSWTAAPTPEGSPEGAGSDGSGILVGVGIPMLVVAGAMITFALHARGFFDSCFPAKRRTYAQQLSRGVVDPVPTNGRH